MRGKARSCMWCRDYTRITLPGNDGSFNKVFNTYVQGAKSRGLPFELTKEQARDLMKQPCYYCGDVETNTGWATRKNGLAFMYNGIDRLDNSRGYTADNVVACCFIHNRAKGERSPEEFVQDCLKVVQHVRNRISRAEEG